MVQLAPCKAIALEDVVSNHFTGECMKPWWCAAAKHALCRAFADRWWDRWGHTRNALAARAAKEGGAAGEKAAAALRKLPAGHRGKCPAGGYHALSPHLLEVAHEVRHTRGPQVAADAAPLGSDQ